MDKPENKSLHHPPSESNKTKRPPFRTTKNKYDLFMSDSYLYQTPEPRKIPGTGSLRDMPKSSFLSSTVSRSSHLLSPVKSEDSLLLGSDQEYHHRLSTVPKNPSKGNFNIERPPFRREKFRAPLNALVTHRDSRTGNISHINKPIVKKGIEDPPENNNSSQVNPSNVERHRNINERMQVGQQSGGGTLSRIRLDTPKSNLPNFNAGISSQLVGFDDNLDGVKQGTKIGKVTKDKKDSEMKAEAKYPNVESKATGIKTQKERAAPNALPRKVNDALNGQLKKPDWSRNSKSFAPPHKELADNENTSSTNSKSNFVKANLPERNKGWNNSSRISAVPNETLLKSGVNKIGPNPKENSIQVKRYHRPQSHLRKAKQRYKMNKMEKEAEYLKNRFSSTSLSKKRQRRPLGSREARPHFSRWAQMPTRIEKVETEISEEKADGMIPLPKKTTTKINSKTRLREKEQQKRPPSARLKRQRTKIVTPKIKSRLKVDASRRFKAEAAASKPNRSRPRTPVKQTRSRSRKNLMNDKSYSNSLKQASLLKSKVELPFKSRKLIGFEEQTAKAMRSLISDFVPNITDAEPNTIQYVEKRRENSKQLKTDKEIQNKFRTMIEKQHQSALWAEDSLRKIQQKSLDLKPKPRQVDELKKATISKSSVDYYTDTPQPNTKIRVKPELKQNPVYDSILDQAGIAKLRSVLSVKRQEQYKNNLIQGALFPRTKRVSDFGMKTGISSTGNKKPEPSNAWNLRNVPGQRPFIQFYDVSKPKPANTVPSKPTKGTTVSHVPKPPKHEPNTFRTPAQLELEYLEMNNLVPPYPGKLPASEDPGLKLDNISKPFPRKLPTPVPKYNYPLPKRQNSEKFTISKDPSAEVHEYIDTSVPYYWLNPESIRRERKAKLANAEAADLVLT